MFTDNLNLIINKECNFKCDFCLSKIINSKINSNDFSIKKIQETLIKWKELSIDNVFITWWEPTMSKNLFEILNIVKNLWYKNVIIVTNWMFLNEKFCKKLKEYWCNNLIISMNGYNKNIFEIQSNKRWTYSIFMKNLFFARRNFDLTINIVINSINIKYLYQQGKLLKIMWINKVNLLHVVPYKKWYKFLPNNIDIKKYINDFIDNFNDFNINLEFFPFCLINKKEYIQNEEELKYNISNLSIWDSLRRKIALNYRIITEECLNCEYKNKCKWFWKI